MASQQHTLSSQTLGGTSCHFFCSVSTANLPGGPTQVTGPILITVLQRSASTRVSPCVNGADVEDRLEDMLETLEDILK